MENNLDKRLKEIFDDCIETHTLEYEDDSGEKIEREELDVERAISGIKEVFKEAGHILPGETLFAMPKGKDLSRKLAGLVDDGTDVVELSPPMMTGQEWYGRFKEEMHKLSSNNIKEQGFLKGSSYKFEWRETLQTARRAAGIEETNG